MVYTMNDKLFKKTYIQLTIILILVFLIGGVLIYKIYSEINEQKDRIIYESDTEMQNDLCGTNRLVFLMPQKKVGTAVLIFNEDYTYSYASYDNGKIEIISTYEYSLDCEKGIIKLKDRDADIVNINEQKYIRTNIKGKSIENWMLYERISE